MEGWISFDFCMKYSNKINKIVLLTTTGISQVRFKTILRIILISMLGNIGFRALNRIVYGNLEIDKTVLKFASLIKQHYKPRTDLSPLFNDNELRQIKIPVLFIGGDSDCFYDSNKTAMRLSENIVDVTSVILKNTGHVLTQTTDLVIDFLKNGK